MPDVPSWAVPHAAMMEAVVAVLAPHAEVVLHDLERDEIVLIRGAFSGRRPGDPSLLSELPPQGDHEQGAVIGPYEKVTAQGRRLLSVSVPVRDERGERRGLLCVNIDKSPVDELVRAVSALAGPVVQARPAALFERDWREQIALLVDGWCNDRGRLRDQLTRAERLELVGRLDAADLFATRHAGQHAALAMAVSRATVYSLLKESRRQQKDHD